MDSEVEEKIDHLSYSSISSYLNCGYNWKLYYLDLIRPPTAPALLFGRAVHETIEDHLRTRQPLIPLWVQHYESLASLEEVEWDSKSSRESLRKDGVRVLSSPPVQDGIEWIADHYSQQSSTIEREISWTVPGVDVPLIGYIDVITDDGIPGDFKTAAKMWSEYKADDDVQSLFYLSGLLANGIEVPELEFRHYVISKGTFPDFRMFSRQRTMDEIEWLNNVIRRAWHGMKAGVFLMSPESWKCNSKFCNYWRLCRGEEWTYEDD